MENKGARFPESFRYFDDMYKLINDNDTINEYKRLRKTDQELTLHYLILKNIKLWKIRNFSYEVFSPDVNTVLIIKLRIFRNGTVHKYRDACSNLSDLWNS